jgi:hypothetical protein
MNQAARMHVKRLFLMETGTYNTQYRRPYETNLQGHTLSQLSEALAGTQKYTPSLLAGVANQVIAPSATAEQAAGIVNGWGERRMRFMMEVENRYMAGGTSTSIILGYTNYPGVIFHSNYIDPKMEFFVNSVVTVRTTLEHTPFGNQTYTNVAENAHVLVDPAYIDAYTPNRTHRMRPEDVYATMSLNHLQGLGDVVDCRTVLSQTPVASRRGNNLAADYAANLLDNYKKATVDNAFGVQQETDVLETARGYAQEQPIGYNSFFQAMTKFRDGVVSNFFTWTDLQRLDPNVDNVTVVAALGQTNHAAPVTGEVHNAGSGMSQDWGGSDRLTQVATILSQSVPALMMELTLTQLAFTTTNRRVLSNAMPMSMSLDGATSPVSTAIANAEGFSSNDLGPYLQHFIVKLEHMVLNDISFKNAVDFHIEMRADLLGETWIKLALDGGPPITYVTPSFADALMVPVITNNENLNLQLSRDFEQVFHHLNDHTGMPGTSEGLATPQFGLI